MKSKNKPPRWLVSDGRYQEWLKHVFDRPECNQGWFFETDDPGFDANRETLMELVTRTFTLAGTDLVAYSDKQVNDGIKYLIYSGCSDIPFALMDEAQPQTKRLELIDSIENLYRDCFAKRCTPVLGHISERSPSPLNDVCYMFWDISNLAYWEDPRHKDRSVTYAAIVNMLGKILRSENIACIESALHGLGHIHSYALDVVESTIERFLKGQPNLPEKLLQYAHAASRGHVQ
ncbi:hypothetical protein Q9Q94_13905 [Uliginosibacterium sp. 31-16]|uniref:hypothetical protein n=1 Tax=Uliginosibacterium sp. 31-16 TaxID=3068315 RepID=UPI00273E04BF|nr:hypothetical protein [Uliginosibacterium sp. 31-16]MDP5240634.1 hypothetical protein [Uliginosibacterium sp. 31-16]